MSNPDIFYTYIQMAEEMLADEEPEAVRIAISTKFAVVFVVDLEPRADVWIDWLLKARERFATMNPEEQQEYMESIYARAESLYA